MFQIKWHAFLIEYIINYLIFSINPHIMRKAFIIISTYIISTLMCISFFLFLFQVFTFNNSIGIGIILFLILTSVVLVTDKDFIQEAE